MNGRFEIQPLAEEHATQSFDAFDFDSIYEFMESFPRPHDVDQVLARIRRLTAGPSPESGQQWFNFTMLLDAEVIGQLQATVVGTSTEVAYVLSPPYSGKGYATKGLLWLIEHLASTCQVVDFWATVDPKNLKSIKLLNRCGFVEDSLPAQGLFSYESGDAVFHLRRSMTP